MLALTLMALLTAAPAEARPPLPAGAEGVRVAFARVGVGTATEAARACVQTQPKVCQPLLRRLELYAALAKVATGLTAPQVQQLLQLDREISPGAPAETTTRVLERFVTGPLELARYHAKSGNPEGARVIARQVLEADPENREAMELAGGDAAAQAPLAPAAAAVSGAM